MSEHFSRGKAIWFLAGIPSAAIVFSSVASATEPVADTPDAKKTKESCPENNPQI